MSGDESDDELDESLKSPANEALERLRARERPTAEDVKLAEPYYQRLANQEKVPFLIIQNSLVLGFNGILYPNRLGGRYVRKICQSAERTFLQDQRISVRELDSEGVVGDGGMLYSGNRDGNYDRRDGDDGYDWETSNQQAGYEGAFTQKELRLYVAEIKRLKAEGKRAETNEQLALCERELKLNTYQGRPKNVDPEEEKKRQAVFHDIRNFYEMLEGKKYGNDESRRIAAYFRKHINFRHGDYRYTGKWKFRYL